MQLGAWKKAASAIPTDHFSPLLLADILDAGLDAGGRYAWARSHPHLRGCSDL